MPDFLDDMRLIVCGSRSCNDRRLVWDTLDALPRPRVVVHGGAAGADALAGLWAQDRGIPVEVHKADWAKHGKSAGPKRNEHMASLGADLAVAFNAGTRGTGDMIKRCKRHQIQVLEISLLRQ